MNAPIEPMAQLIYAGEGHYQLFYRDRGRNIASGEKTPVLPLFECERLLKTGFFTPVGDIWSNISKNHQWRSDPDEIDGMLTGQRCFILGGGPSAKGFDFSRLDNEFTIAVNYSYKHYPKSKSVLFCDYGFAEREKQNLLAYSGLIFGSFKCQDILPQKNNIFIFPISNRELGRGFNEGLYNHRLSGAAALNLAIIMNAEEIYLLGFDMGYNENKEHHWYGTEFERQNTYSETHFIGKVDLFNKFAAHKNKIFNCSKESRIKVFQYANINEVLNTPYDKSQNQRIVLRNIESRKAQARPQTVAVSNSGPVVYPTSKPQKLSKINDMYKGKRIFVIGSGPSVKGIDLNRLDGEITIAVNHTIEHYKKAKVSLFGDPRVYGYVSEIYKNYKGLIFASHHTNIGSLEQANDNVFIFAKNAEKVTTNILNGLYSDFNSGMEAVNLALVMGAAEVYLLGIDFCANNNEYYFYGRPSWFKNSIKQVDTLLDSRVKFWDNFEPFKDRIFNCSKISRISVFEKVDLDKVLKNGNKITNANVVR